MENLFDEYTFMIDHEDSSSYDPCMAAVDVIITTKTGIRYSAPFVTPNFVDTMFEKNARTGECARGSYFCMPGMIIVREMSDAIVGATIEDLIANAEIEHYFEELN